MFSGKLYSIILVMGLLLIPLNPSNAQEYYSTRSVVVEDLIEQIARDSDEELDYHTLFQDIYFFLENPLNLNIASRAELEKLHLLTDFQITSLQQYIEENGPLLSIYELPLVYGFNESSARTIKPLVSFDPPDRDMQPGKRKSSHQLLMRVSSVLEEQVVHLPLRLHPPGQVPGVVADAEVDVGPSGGPDRARQRHAPGRGPARRLRR